MVRTVPFKCPQCGAIYQVPLEVGVGAARFAWYN